MRRLTHIHSNFLSTGYDLNFRSIRASESWISRLSVLLHPVSFPLVDINIDFKCEQILGDTVSLRKCRNILQ